MPVKAKVYKPPGEPTSSQRARWIGTRTARGYDNNWLRESGRYLRAHPLCEAHLRRDEIVAATLVDHVIPHKGDQQLFWDQSNWQALCAACHGTKTACEDGGFGNPVRSRTGG